MLFRGTVIKNNLSIISRSYNLFESRHPGRSRDQRGSSPGGVQVNCKFLKTLDSPVNRKMTERGLFRIFTRASVLIVAKKGTNRVL